MKIFFGSTPHGKGTPSAAERQTTRLQTQAARTAQALAETSAAHDRTSGAARLSEPKDPPSPGSSQSKL